MSKTILCITGDSNHNIRIIIYSRSDLTRSINVISLSDVGLFLVLFVFGLSSSLSSLSYSCSPGMSSIVSLSSLSVLSLSLSQYLVMGSIDFTFFCFFFLLFWYLIAELVVLGCLLFFLLYLLLFFYFSCQLVLSMLDLSSVWLSSSMLSWNMLCFRLFKNPLIIFIDFLIAAIGV